jgi:valyl-tRNA synthetase
VAREKPGVCGKCGAANWEQDPDVLDTWFSSALWPFEVFGWPEKTPDLDYFYPTNVNTPGYEIIPFWVARMIFSGLEFVGDIPFRTAFIHGMVRDEQGRKMSKSLGNGIDPVDVIDKYGADALRLTLLMGIGNGSDLRFAEERCEAMRNFGNKIWNAARFVLMNLKIDAWELPAHLETEDKWILHKYNELIPAVTDALDRYDLGLTAQKLYDFIWHDFCDWYIELVKPRLFDGGEDAQRVLGHVFSGVLTLLHPFMPFLTEEIWQALPRKGRGCDMLVTGKWPCAGSLYASDAAAMERVMDGIKAIRQRRTEMNIPPSRKPALYVISDAPESYRQASALINKLAGTVSLEVLDSKPAELSAYIQIATQEALFLLPTDQLIDRDAEKVRLQAELKKLEAELTPLRAKLANHGFISKAPAAVVESEKEREAALSARLNKVREGLAELT